MATNLHDAGTFETFIARERERLSAERSELYDQQKALEEKLEGINRELAAIKAYEDAKRGKLPTAAPAEGRQRRAPRQAGGRGKREDLLNYIKEHFEAGVTRAELLNSMNIDEKDEEGKRRAQSVSNALSALKKTQQLRQEGRTYIPV